VYWMQASSMSVLGDNSRAARLPSAVAMTLTLALFTFATRTLAGPRRATWAVLVLASSIMVLISAKASTTDSVLLLFVTVAQFCLYAIWPGRGTWPVWITLGLAVGLAGLTKGPVVLGVMATTLITLGLLRWSLRPKRPQTPPAAFEV